MLLWSPWGYWPTFIITPLCNIWTYICVHSYIRVCRCVCVYVWTVVRHPMNMAVQIRRNSAIRVIAMTAFLLFFVHDTRTITGDMFKDFVVDLKHSLQIYNKVLKTCLLTIQGCIQHYYQILKRCFHWTACLVMFFNHTLVGHPVGNVKGRFQM